MDRVKQEIRAGCITAPLSIPLGAAIIYLFLALAMGSFSDAGALILISIVCTLGISLIIWLPACLIVGYIPIYIIRLLRASSSQSELASANVSADASASDQEQPPGSSDNSPNANKTALSNDQLALISYIKKATVQGLNQERILQNLQSNGWSKDSISWAFDFLANNGQGLKIS